MVVSYSAEQGSGSRHSHPWMAQALFALDVVLRRRHAVFEYCCHPNCIFRLDLTRSSRSITLRDGTCAPIGQRIARLHFWNEHIPPVPQSGATIAWARQMQGAIAISLYELARYLASRSDLDDVTVICGDVPSGTKTQAEQLGRIMGYYGFEVIPGPERLPPGLRLQRFGENILISLMVFAQNAAALRFDTLNRVRVPIYFSRRLLNEKFGPGGEQAPRAVVA